MMSLKNQVKSIFFGVLAAVTLQAGTAHAYTVGPLGYYNVAGAVGTQTPFGTFLLDNTANNQDFWLSLNASSSSTIRTGPLETGNLLDLSASFFGDGRVLDLNGTQVGTVSYSLQLEADQLRYSAANNVIAAVSGLSTVGALIFGVQIDMFNAPDITFSTGMGGAGMPFSLGGFDGRYDNVINAFGTNGVLDFMLAFGNIGANAANNFEGWLTSLVFGVNNAFYTLHGDIHAGFQPHCTGGCSSVPEPTSIALLSFGLLGAAARRRRQSSETE